MRACSVTSTGGGWVESKWFFPPRGLCGGKKPIKGDRPPATEPAADLPPQQLQLRMMRAPTCLLGGLVAAHLLLLAASPAPTNATQEATRLVHGPAVFRIDQTDVDLFWVGLIV